MSNDPTFNDPLDLNIALKDVETDFPLLPEADYELLITDVLIEPNKDAKQGNGTGRNIRLTLVTQTGVLSVDGTRQVKPGTKLSVINALQPKPDAEDPDGYKRMLGQMVDGIFGTTAVDRPDLTMELLNSTKGKLVVAHVKVDSYEGRKSNKVSAIRRPV